MLPTRPTTFADVAHPVLQPFLDAEHDALLATPVEWLPIPAISADPDHAANARASAEWCARRMERVGLEHVTLLPTAGHPSFEALLTRERDRLGCDVVIVSDTAMWAPGMPSMCTGMRGLVAVGVTLRSAPSDLHSGSFGGAVARAKVAFRLVPDQDPLEIPDGFEQWIGELWHELASVDLSAGRTA